ncbi:related to putative dual specificity protein kinase pom1 [Rhynchosporium agropyri]|uniref:Related to putative dual specificity protein kinase pom1 n=1 Tax=Rhynchosporium agropyri TaxID=914238 RepID=A0A1E1KTL9_9HELO|nr:related to putative dual specificity protein kinase pom1 [Rhynchosporium agropyri]
MLREKKGPSGPRPDYSPSKVYANLNENPHLGPADFYSSDRQENYDPGARARIESGQQPFNAPTRKNHSLFSFGGKPSEENLGGSYEFLPSQSFDDLHSSIATASNDFFERPTGIENNSTIGGKRSNEAMNTSMAEAKGNGGTARIPSAGPRPVRSTSILRRQSTSTRQSSISSTASGATGNMDPPSAPLATRNRRQSQYPPLSGSATANSAKAPRKSIGPGGLTDSDYARAAQRRRPSLASSVSSQGQSDTGGVSTRVNVGGAPKYPDGARGLTASRAAKTKSLQPPSRQGQTLLTPKSSTPDHNRSSSFAGRSPGRIIGRGNTTPSSSAKRMSMMPGMPTSSSHATGLGARTVSPTDARRAKRLSILQNPPPMPHTPPTPQTEAATIRTSSRSPSMLPRKISTPSSSRTTPDVNRKSYSSGLSNGSNASYNTCRTSTGSLQFRMQLPPSSSRLPTPKPRNAHSSTGNDEEEEVPPVPAIPKAYESPKDSPAEPPFFKPKSTMPFDASSINSTSTNSLSGRASIREPPKNDREPKPRKYGPPAPSDDQQNHAAPAKKKNLQPLRLPPLNLLPLSTPTTVKIAALESKDASYLDGQTTPPPRRMATKTPSTPMTASKASFFSRRRTDSKAEDTLSHMRSSSSIHFLRSDTSSQLGGGGAESTKPIPITSRQTRQSVSPYISSSLPKNGGEHLLMPRSKTSGDFSALDTSNTEHPRPARLNGPRAQKITKPAKNDAPTRPSSQEEPTTPSSGTSLRRKLSLGWKRSTSKSNINASHAAGERESEYPPQPPKHDNMPPPRVPASASISNASNQDVPSPSPSVKSTTYLDSKRRKSSISGMTIFNGHDRTRSDSWGLNGSSKKEQPTQCDRPPPSSRSTSSVMQKMLTSKSSSGTIRTTDRWTVDCDKDDMIAESEVKKLAMRRKDTEQAAQVLDALRQRAIPQERISPQSALQVHNLNIYERGEIVDYKDIYFAGTPTAAKHVGQLAADSANFGYDDERGDYSIICGDHLSYRYEIIDVLGKGSFGQVVRCIDHKLGTLVAIKIIRNKKRFHQQALVEVNILQKLREWDPKNKHSMVNFTQSFYFRGHLCISTELLDMNLYEFIKSNAFKGFSLKIVRRFTKQMLSSLLLLKQHKVIHCDLKPENILLAHPMHSEIKVIDFGSSCFENEKVYTYIQSRFYRSPEVILGMTYGMPIDMWSLGCILAELYTGVPIFPGENEQEQLSCIMEVFGPPGKHLIDKSTRKKLFFDSLGKPRLTVSSKGRRRKPSSKTLQQVLKCDDESFLDFLTRCLRWDPDNRMKPEEAVRHEFLTGQKMSAPLPRMSARNESKSPIKRTSTVATTPSGGNRPLPEPPVTSFKNGTAVRQRQTIGASPSKNAVPAQGPPRRQSNINVGGLVGGGASRRMSMAGGAVLAPGSSGLPRVTRSVSGKLAGETGMASAGASAAMNKRA